MTTEVWRYRLISRLIGTKHLSRWERLIARSQRSASISVWRGAFIGVRPYRLLKPHSAFIAGGRAPAGCGRSSRADERSGNGRAGGGDGDEHERASSSSSNAHDACAAVGWQLEEREQPTTGLFRQSSEQFCTIPRCAQQGIAAGHRCRRQPLPRSSRRAWPKT